MATRTIHCYGSNKVYECRDESPDDFDPSGSFRVEDGGAWREPTRDEKLAVRAEALAERYLDREVWCLDSGLVSDLLAVEDGGLGGEFSYDNVSGLRPDPSDWDLAKCKAWLDDEGHDLPDPNPWAMTREDLVQAHQDRTGTDVSENYPSDLEVVRKMALAAIDDEGDNDEFTEAFREAVSDHAEDAEIFEWYRVSQWLAEELDAEGQCVLDNSYGTWWGRCCSGQSVMLDGVFQAIARKHLLRTQSS